MVKQCYISKIPIPEWLNGDVLDVRKVTSNYVSRQLPLPPHGERRRFNIPGQLAALELEPFQGRQHSGIDDTRNIARVVAELGRRGVRLEANTRIHQGRTWPWMGKTNSGEIREEFCGPTREYHETLTRAVL